MDLRIDIRFLVTVFLGGFDELVRGPLVMMRGFSRSGSHTTLEFGGN